MYYLRCGHRWHWRGRRWLACGGGVSLDAAIRRPGRDWWPEEEISSQQGTAIAAGGAAR